MGLELDKRFHGKPTQMKFKIGVSGCTMQCSENCIKDFGLLGRPKGWTATAGGNGGSSPRLAQVLAEGLSDDEALSLAEKVLEVYTNEAPKVKLGKWIENHRPCGIQEETRIAQRCGARKGVIASRKI